MGRLVAGATNSATGGGDGWWWWWVRVILLCGARAICGYFFFFFLFLYIVRPWGINILVTDLCRKKKLSRWKKKNFLPPARQPPKLESIKPTCFYTDRCQASPQYSTNNQEARRRTPRPRDFQVNTYLRPSRHTTTKLVVQLNPALESDAI